MSTPLQLLLIEDSETDAYLLRRELTRGGFDVTATRVDRLEDLRSALHTAGPAWELIISDYNLPGFNGMDALAALTEVGLDIPFILVSGAVGEETAVEAMKAGARDYIRKDHFHRLLPAVHRELSEAVTRRERRQAERTRESLYQIAQAAAQTSTLHELMAALHGIIGQMMPAKNLFLALYDWKADNLSFPYFADEYDQPPQPNPLDDGLTSYVIRTGQPLFASPEVLAQLLSEHHLRIIGAPPVDWLGVPLFGSAPPENGDPARAMGALVVQAYDAGVRYTHHDLEMLTFVSSQAALIIERKRAEQRLADQQDFLRQVIDINPHLIYAKDRFGRFTLANQAVAATFGVEVDDLIGLSEQDLHPNLHGVQSFRHDDADILDYLQEKSIPEEAIMDAQGRQVWLQTIKRPLVLPGGEVQMLGVATDISERKHAEDQLIHNAFHDALTNLPNRALLIDRLGQAIERARRRPENISALLLLDVDRFAVINDSLGHEMGDLLLNVTATRLQRGLRSVDTLARTGGDEFAILVEEAGSLTNITEVIDRLLKALAHPFQALDREVTMTASLGLVFGFNEYERPEDMLRDADIALHEAKQNGRNRYAVFENTMRTNFVSQLELASELRQAIERDELLLNYEPIISLRTGQVCGFEALVRWLHPRRGLIPPLQFIPFAEENGLIVPMGGWVLTEACRQMHGWRQRFPSLGELTVSVNLSNRQLAEDDLIRRVSTTLAETGLPANALRLEITESVIMENAEASIATLNQLRAMGVQIDIDDFGTGYSSLVYLHRLPLNAIKIDRSFVSGRSSSSVKGSGLDIVRTIVRLAADLGMQTIAEGVETVEQRQSLARLGCDFMQGHLITRSIDLASVEQFLTAQCSALSASDQVKTVPIR